MKFLTLDYITQHLRLDTTCEDALLELYGNSAEETLANMLNRGKTVDEMVGSLVEEYGEVPNAVKQAALMLVDLSYQYRSPISPTNVSPVLYTFEVQLKPYMKL